MMTSTENGRDLIAVRPSTGVTVLPPDSGIIGKFLDETANMFKARAMRMSGLLRRINESGQRAELMLRMAAERMEAAEDHLEQDLRARADARGCRDCRRIGT